MQGGEAIVLGWSDEYYRIANGHCPVEEFIEEQDPEVDWPEIFGAIGMLNGHDGNLGLPYVEKIEDVYNLWVLRVRVYTTPSIQILYSRLIKGKTHLMFHAFWSNSQEVPEQELSTAVGLMSEPRAKARLTEGV